MRASIMSFIVHRYNALYSILGVFAALAILVPLTGATSASAAVSGYPTGVTLSGLQSGMSTTQLEAEIQAAASAPWNVSDIRLQVEQDKLTWKSGNCPINTDPVCGPYLQQIKDVVNYALGLGLTVVINDQTETAPNYTADEPAPTHATEVFWSYVAPVWAGNSKVVYDIFNEPRGATLASPGTATSWGLWRNGGKFQDGNTYLGENTIVNYIRGLGSNETNRLWVEGLGAAGTLDGILNGTGTPGIAQDEVSDPLHSITYAFHHPDDIGAGQNSTSWWQDFGYIVNHSGNFSVIDGEFNNSVDGGQFCWSGFPGIWGNVSTGYKQYLQGKNVGMTVWTFGPVGTVNGVNNVPLHAVSNTNGAIDMSGVTPNDANGTSWSMSAPTSLSLNTPAAYAVPATEQGSPSQSWACGATNDASMGQDFANYANGS